MTVIIGNTDRPNKVHPIFDRILRDIGRPKDQSVTPIESIFHTFDVINRKNGKAMRLTAIGKNRTMAADTIINYNLAGVDWENERFLAPVSTPEEEAAAMELRTIYPQIREAKDEIAYQAACHEEAPNRSEYSDMLQDDSARDLKTKLEKLESHREELEGILSNW